MYCLLNNESKITSLLYYPLLPLMVHLEGNFVSINFLGFRIDGDLNLFKHITLTEYEIYKQLQRTSDSFME